MAFDLSTPEAVERERRSVAMASGATYDADEVYALLTRLLEALQAVRDTRERMAQVVPPWKPQRRC